MKCKFLGIAIDPRNGDKKLVIAGGGELSTTIVLNLKTLRWDKESQSLPRVISHGSSVQYRDTFLIVGGWNGDEIFKTIFEFNPIDNSWIERPEKLQKGRVSSAVFMMTNELDQCN